MSPAQNLRPARLGTVVNLSRKIELEKAANDGGFEVIEPQLDGTITLASSDVEARLRVSAGEAGFVVAVDDAGLARELSAEGRYEAGGPQAFAATRPEDMTPSFAESGNFPAPCRTRH